MSPVFLLLPGIAGWQIVDVRGRRVSQPLTSGSVPEPVAGPVTEPAPPQGARNKQR